MEQINLFTLSRNLISSNALPFNKERSVWRQFQDDDNSHLMKCLEQDLEYGKLFRVAKDEYDALKRAIFNDYLALKDIFTALSTNSSYPTLSWNDYSLFVNRSKLPDKRLIIAEIDRALISTNYTTNKYKNSAEKELHRYEFIEIIVRLSIVKYLQPKIFKSMVESF